MTVAWPLKATPDACRLIAVDVYAEARPWSKSCISWTHGSNSDPTGLRLPASESLVVGRTIVEARDSDLPLEWLETCLREHQDCRIQSSHDEQGLLPSRVIDVGDRGTTELVRLIEPGDAKGLYAALTYRWGNGHIVKTTMSSLERHMDRIDWDTLNQLYKDAVVMTQNMGLRYLWIDSICIVQDSRQDFDREVANMASIYSNAIVTLSAAWAESTDVGLFPERPQYREESFSISSGRTPEIFLSRQRAKELRKFSDDVDNGPLSTRGWTFQERLLSRRLIHFGAHQRHWECLSMRSSEAWASIDGYQGLGIAAPFRADPLRYVYQEKSFESADKTQNNRTIRAWRNLVQVYSKKGLSDPQDKLPAVTGMMKHLEARYHMSFTWGMCFETLFHCLLWSVHKGVRVTPPRSPSWSWASVDGQITFKMPDSPTGTLVESGRLIDVSDRNCWLSARARRVSFRRADENVAEFMSCTTVLETTDGQMLGVGDFDDWSDDWDAICQRYAASQLCVVLLMQETEDGCRSRTYGGDFEIFTPYGLGLVLEVLDSIKALYQRIGFARITDWKLMEQEPLHKLCII